MKNDNEGSEFGLGFAYCLGLFLAHAEKFSELRSKKELHFPASNWFNAASDHFYDFQVDYAPPSLKERCVKLRDYCLEAGHGRGLFGAMEVSWDDVDRCIQEAKDILREYDSFNKIPTIKGRWE